MALAAGHRRSVLEAAAALGAVALALAWEALFRPGGAAWSPFLAVAVAVTLLAWWRGARVAVPALVAGWLGCTLLFADVRRGILQGDVRQSVGVLLHLVLVGLVVLLAEQKNRVLRRAREAEAVLEHKRSRLAEALEDASRAATILSSVREAIIVLDLNGLVTYWGQGATDLFGWTTREMLGRFLPDRYPEPVRERVMAGLQQIASGELNWEGEFEDVHRDGSSVWIHARAHRYSDASGRPVGIIGVAYDLTARKQAEEEARASAETLRLVTDALPAYISYVGADERYRWANKSFEEVHGVPRSRIVGSRVAEVLSPDIYASVQPYIARALAGEPVRFETSITRPDGVPVVVQGTYLPDMEAGRVRGYFALILDVTERYEADQELRRHREHLETLVIERTAEVQEAHRREREHGRLAAIGTLAAGVGHDLANLLLPVRVRLDTLARIDLPPAAKDDLSQARAGLEYLQRISTGLRLMAADAERTGPGPAGTDLSEWWSEVEAVFRAGLPRGVGLKGRLGKGLAVAMPKHQLTQAVFNLVQNAGEAMDGADVERRLVTVRAAAGRAGGGARTVEIEVADTGPGMPPDVLARCFEPYFSTKTRGIATGMGLAMVRGIFERWGGSITASSGAEGTTFRIVVPEAEPAAVGERPICLAAVSPALGRPGDIATVLLEALGVAVRRGPEIADADVWVTEPVERPRLAAFLAGGPRRRVVVCGPAAESAPAGPFPGIEKRVAFVGADPRAGELRRALSAAVGDLTEGEKRAVRV